MPKFTVEISMDVKITIDQRLLDTIDDEWRSMFYDFTTDEEVAEHLSYNWAVNNITRLKKLEGFANLPDDYWQIHSIEVTTTGTSAE